MVDGAPCGEPQAGDVSLSALWSSSSRAQRAYAHRARRGYAPPPPRAHQVRDRRPRERSPRAARRVAAHAAAPALAVAPAAPPRLALLAAEAGRGADRRDFAERDELAVVQLE